MMNFTEYALKNRAFVYFFVFVLVVGGVYSFFTMSKLEDPAITVKQAMVVTAYPGASAYQVELEVTDVLEKAIRSMGDLDHVSSRSMDDVSEIMVELSSTVPLAELQQKWDILRRKVMGAQAQLPDGAQPSIVMDDFGDVYGMFYAMTSDGFDYQEMSDYAELVRRSVLDIDGVSSVDVYGERQSCINVEFLEDKMANMGVHPAEIIMTLNGQNKTVYSGYFDSGEKRVRVNVNGAYKEIEDIRNLLIKGHEQDQIRLSDVARVTKGYVKPEREGLLYDTLPAIAISIAMEEGGNILQLGKKVDAKLAELKEDIIPAGIDFQKVFFHQERGKGVSTSTRIFSTSTGEECYQRVHGELDRISGYRDLGGHAFHGIPERVYHRGRSGDCCIGFVARVVHDAWDIATSFVGLVYRGDGNAGG